MMSGATECADSSWSGGWKVFQWATCASLAVTLALIGTYVVPLCAYVQSAVLTTLVVIQFVFLLTSTMLFCIAAYRQTRRRSRWAISAAFYLIGMFVTVYVAAGIKQDVPALREVGFSVSIISVAVSCAGVLTCAIRAEFQSTAIPSAV